MMAEPAKTTLERHIQTLISAAALALLAWNFLQVQNLTVQVARMSEKLAALTERVDVTVEHRYNSVDAARDFRARDQILEDLVVDVIELRERLREIEARVPRVDIQ